MARIKAQPIINRMYSAPPGSAKDGYPVAGAAGGAQPGGEQPPPPPYQVNGSVPPGRYPYQVGTPTSAPAASPAAGVVPQPYAQQPQQPGQFAPFYVSSVRITCFRL